MNNQQTPQGYYDPQTGQPLPPPEYPAGAAPGQPGYPPPPGYPPQQPQYPPPPGYPPQQPGYPPPQGYGYPQASSSSRGKGTAALVLGIVALVCVWFGYFAILSFIAAIVGLILAVQARKELPAGTTGVATAGMVLCIITLALSVLMILCVVLLGAALCGAYSEFSSLLY